jgi:hypothetical protein
LQENNELLKGLDHIFGDTAILVDFHWWTMTCGAISWQFPGAAYMWFQP